MATQLDRGELDLQEQIARIKKMQADLDKTFEETRHLRSVSYEKAVADLERLKTETELLPRNMIFQAMLATAALLAAGAAIAKLFFP